VEAGPRGRIPTTLTTLPPLRIRRNRRSNLRNDRNNDGVRSPRIFVPFEPWRINDCDAFIVRFYGVVCGVLSVEIVQEFQRVKLEARNVVNGVVISGCLFYGFFYFEYFDLGGEIVGRGTVWNVGDYLFALVWNFVAVGFYWELFWVQKK